MRELIEELAAERSFDPETVRILAVAFDNAWATLQASGAPIASPPYAEMARGILAKHIIRMASEGERDPQQLCSGATLELAKTSLSQLRKARQPAQRGKPADASASSKRKKSE
jgi:hypothetical protein